MKDYYGLLGLHQKATKAEIKKNYRLLATKYHPDKNSDPRAADIFIEISEAYDTLSNRRSKAQYDLLRWQTIKNKQAADQSWSTTVPPKESTRSRRNKAQHKRSHRYHREDSRGMRGLWLIVESLYVLSRYILHILTITLMIVVVRSAATQIGAGFSEGILRGIGLSIFVIGLVYGVFKVAQHAYREVNKDIPIFSIYYKMTQLQVISYVLPIFLIAITIYLFVLGLY